MALKRLLSLNGEFISAGIIYRTSYLETIYDFCLKLAMANDSVQVLCLGFAP